MKKNSFGIIDKDPIVQSNMIVGKMMKPIVESTKSDNCLITVMSKMSCLVLRIYYSINCTWSRKNSQDLLSVLSMIKKIVIFRNSW